MRKNKYRVWDKDLKKMYYHSGLTIWKNEIYSDLNIPLQYTGLKDKNGKEIYEGDVIHGSLVLWEIVFKQGCFIGINDKGNKLELYIIENREIIGNIYENPEL